MSDYDDVDELDQRIAETERQKAEANSALSDLSLTVEERQRAIDTNAATSNLLRSLRQERTKLRKRARARTRRTEQALMGSDDRFRRGATTIRIVDDSPQRYRLRQAEDLLREAGFIEQADGTWE